MTNKKFSFRSFFGLRRGDKAIKQASDEASMAETPGSTPSSTPRSALGADTFEEPRPKPVKEKVPVPVKIPISYYYSQTMYVGGKKVPFTRLHAKQNRRRLIIYERIYEDRAFCVNWRGD
ncbi:hypothetical protein ACHHYP_12436 [Achlya hypogyna]|uniref:Uncharacterized protein n=1 Tax=Achlya hypogyna TaxID=1202772 RepID=A0A1V9YH04_ACHHY|nr:hypothetical protein ACHHYP_12436 [Achlya hypogyna]